MEGINNEQFTPTPPAASAPTSPSQQAQGIGGSAAQPAQAINAAGPTIPSPQLEQPTPFEVDSPLQDANAEIIAQLQAQNAALMQQNNLLNQQVINLVQNGGQLNSGPSQVASNRTAYNPPAQSEPAVSNRTTYNRPTQAEQLAAMGMQFEATPSYMQPPVSLSNAPDVTLESLANEIGKDRPKH